MYIGVGTLVVILLIVLIVFSCAARRGSRVEGSRSRAVTAEAPVVLDDDWQPARPVRRVAFGIDDPSLQTVVVVECNPNCAFDEEYQQFIRLVRQTVTASMSAALLRATELGDLRHISDTHQHAMLDVASDLPTVAARYHPHTKPHRRRRLVRRHRSGRRTSRPHRR